VVGNSLKYTNSSTSTLHSNNLWKYYQLSHTSSPTLVPGHLLLSPLDNSKVLNFMQFSTLGTDLTTDISAFKKIQYFSKTNPQSLYSDLSEFTLKYNKLSNLYLNTDKILNSNTYGTIRQHNHLSTTFTGSSSQTLTDLTSLDKYLDYNYNIQPRFIPESYSGINSQVAERLSTIDVATLHNDFTTKLKSQNLVLPSYPLKSALSGSENDAKHFLNPLKSIYTPFFSKKFFIDNS